MRLGILVALALSACSTTTPSARPSPSLEPSQSPSATPEPTIEPTLEVRSIVVLLDLHDPGAWPAGSTSCSGTGGYDDVSEGMQLTIRDQDNQIRGVGSLQGGMLLDPDTCSFFTTITDVGEADFYVVESGRRGSLTYTLEELEQAGWIVNIRLGE